MPKKSFENKYPNISRWVNQENGIIEIGWRDNGEDEYESIDDALLALEGGVQICMREIHGDSWESS